jgi:hypothetical protein
MRLRFPASDGSLGWFSFLLLYWFFCRLDIRFPHLPDENRTESALACVSHTFKPVPQAIDERIRERVRNQSISTVICP